MISNPENPIIPIKSATKPGKKKLFRRKKKPAEPPRPPILHVDYVPISKWCQDSPWEPKIQEILKQFNIPSLRPVQKAVINAALANRDVFACISTGGGKSLTFQVPALVTDGITVVVMPLISLMKDQADQLEKFGIKYVNLAGEADEEMMNQLVSIVTQCYQKTLKEYPKVIFVAPEKLDKSRQLIEILKNLNKFGMIQRFVIDEAHCVIVWGQDFRSSYLSLTKLKKLFPKIPILALTATITKEDLLKTLNYLYMSDVVCFRTTFNRQNLKFEVMRKDKNRASDQIANFINQKYPEKCGIVFASSRKECEEIARKLSMIYQIKAAHYHAEMDPVVKETTQNDWINDKIHVIVATIAFGMGINKPDVRFVIHYNFSKSLINYYQEAGRAGRDGNNSDCLILYHPADKKTFEAFIANSNSQLKEKERFAWDLYRIIDYCENEYRCRRVDSLEYFQEKITPADCNFNCDNCQKFVPTKLLEMNAQTKVIFKQIGSNVITVDHLDDLYTQLLESVQDGGDENDYKIFCRQATKVEILKLLKELIIRRHISLEYVQDNGGTKGYDNSFKIKVRIDKERVLDLYLTDTVGVRFPRDQSTLLPDITPPHEKNLEPPKPQMIIEAPKQGVVVGSMETCKPQILTNMQMPVMTPMPINNQNSMAISRPMNNSMANSMTTPMPNRINMPTSLPTNMTSGPMNTLTANLTNLQIPHSGPNSLPGNSPKSSPTNSSNPIPESMPSFKTANTLVSGPKYISTSNPINTNNTLIPQSAPGSLPGNSTKSSPTNFSNQIPANMPNFKPNPLLTSGPMNISSSIPANQPTSMPQNGPTSHHAGNLPRSNPTNMSNQMQTNITSSGPMNIQTSNHPTNQQNFMPNNGPTSYPGNSTKTTPTRLPNSMSAQMSNPTNLQNSMQTNASNFKPTNLPTSYPPNIQNSMPPNNSNYVPVNNQNPMQKNSLPPGPTNQQQSYMPRNMQTSAPTNILNSIQKNNPPTTNIPTSFPTNNSNSCSTSMNTYNSNPNVPAKNQNSVPIQANIQTYTHPTMKTATNPYGYQNKDPKLYNNDFPQKETPSKGKVVGFNNQNPQSSTYPNQRVFSTPLQNIMPQDKKLIVIDDDNTITNFADNEVEAPNSFKIMQEKQSKQKKRDLEILEATINSQEKANRLDRQDSFPKTAIQKYEQGAQNLPKSYRMISNIVDPFAREMNALTRKLTPLKLKCLTNPEQNQANPYENSNNAVSNGYNNANNNYNNNFKSPMKTINQKMNSQNQKEKEKEKNKLEACLEELDDIEYLESLLMSQPKKKLKSS